MIKIEIETFHNGNLKEKIVLEPSTNFWLHYDPRRDIWYGTWVPTESEIVTIFLTYLGINGVNEQIKRYRRNNRYRG